MKSILIKLFSFNKEDEDDKIWIKFNSVSFILNSVLFINLILIKMLEFKHNFNFDLILLIFTSFLMIISLFFKKFIIFLSFLLNCSNIIFILINFDIYRLLISAEYRRHYAFFMGLSSLIININFTLISTLPLSILSNIFFSMAFTISLNKIESYFRIVIFVILFSPSINIYILNRFKSKKFKESNLSLQQALEWKEIFLEMIPNSLIAFLKKKNIEIKSKNKRKKSWALRNERKSRFFSIFEQFGEMKYINNEGIKKYNINNSDNFFQFLEKIQISCELESLRTSKNENVFNLKKFFCFNGIFNSHKNLQEKVKIYIHEIFWQNDDYVIFRMESLSLEDEVFKLKELNQYKDQILSSVSHDLRTPLNGINFVLEKIQELSRDDKEIIQFTNMARTNSALLLSLINDILDYSQIKANKLKIVVSSFVLKELIDEVIFLMNISASLKNISIKLSYLIEETIVINSDERRLKQVLINLISNAIKFTNKGYVEVIISSFKTKYIKFEIIDTGIGIDKDIIPKLAQPFETFDTSGLNQHGIGYLYDIYSF